MEEIVLDKRHYGRITLDFVVAPCKRGYILRGKKDEHLQSSTVAQIGHK